MLKLSIISISTSPKYLKMLPPERPEYSLKCVKTVGGYKAKPQIPLGELAALLRPRSWIKGIDHSGIGLQHI
jgi:hypothetical protein